MASRPKVDFRLMRTLIINSITMGVAAGLLRNRRANAEIEPGEWPAGAEAPCVQIIVSARNEERNIGPLLASLVAQRYPPGRWGIAVVDDSSSDDTARIASSLAQDHLQLKVVHAAPLPPGWTGKNHAMYSGYLASPQEAEWLLFLDADTRHAPQALSSAIIHAQRKGADLMSLVIGVEAESFWDRVLVPQVGEIYALLVGTMDQVNSDGTTAAANGQFLLIRRSVYARLGDLPEVRSDVAEDRALALAAKRHGYRVRLEYGRKLAYTRPYASFGEMWRGYTKTLFWAGGRNTWRALGVVAALSLYAFTPLFEFGRALTTTGSDRRKGLGHGALQLGPMLALRAYVCGLVWVPAAYAFTYPLAVAVGNLMLLHSIYRVLSGREVEWKGRGYGPLKGQTPAGWAVRRGFPKGGKFFCIA